MGTLWHACKKIKKAYNALALFCTMAHKKAGGSTQNIRDSKPKYRGVKRFGGEAVSAGEIIVRQCGMAMKAGEGVYAGRDFTLHAAVSGKVAFSKKQATRFDGRHYRRTVVSVTPAS